LDVHRAAVTAGLAPRASRRRASCARALRPGPPGARADRVGRAHHLARLARGRLAERLGRPARPRRRRPRHHRAAAVGDALAHTAVGRSTRGSAAGAGGRLPVAGGPRVVLGGDPTMRGVLSLLRAIAALAACRSPEETRQRAGGPGADVGNRGGVELHAGANPYARTPVVLPRPESGEVAASPRER